MINSKNKGNTYERKIMNELKTILNNPSIKTSRNESKTLDNKKVDLANVKQYNIQLKNTKNYMSLNKIQEILEVMPKDKPNILFNKANYKTELVILTKEDFYRIINKCIDG